MNSDNNSPDHRRGPIAWMATNSVAANLLMFVILVTGAFGLMRVKQEVFPAFDLDVVTIGVPYPGASPAEVEQSIVLAVEEEVRGLDGVKRVISAAAEGNGVVNVELLLGADPDKVLSDVKTAVDRIRTFPEDAEEPNINLVSRRSRVITLMIHGDQDLATLEAIAEDARTRLLQTSSITQADIRGVRALEVEVEVGRETLEALSITPDDLARSIRSASTELPGGGIQTEQGEVLVRVADRLDGHLFSDVIVRGRLGGNRVRLGDIATVTDAYANEHQASYFDGQRAVRIDVFRVGDERPTEVADTTKRVMSELRADLPANIGLALWDDDSQILRDRIDLLTRNARSGLILVMIILTLFLDLRLAFWVALGIPISFLGAFMMMPALGLSINMITLFALIVTLGMVVDDAIIVGDNIFHKTSNGEDQTDAAIKGAQEMAVPVTFSILTTMAAFAPMFAVPGTMGKVFVAIPAMVLAVLFFSLLESFYILPAHLAHSKHGGEERGIFAVAHWAHKIASNLLNRFIQGVYQPAIDKLLTVRYVVFAAAMGLLLVTGSMVANGVVPQSFFPQLEGDVVTAFVRLPWGSPIERAEEIQELIESSAFDALEESGEPEMLTNMATFLGERPAGGFGDQGETGSHLVTVKLQLVPSGDRKMKAAELADRWERATPPLPGVQTMTFSAASGPSGGAAVDIQLSHPNTDSLGDASLLMAQRLRQYTALTAIQNTWSLGKPQIDLHLKPRGTELGLTSNEVGRQVRSAFFGAEAVRQQRGRHEVKVMVRLPTEQRRSEYDLESLMIRAPSGVFVPLPEIADVERGRAPTAIAREDSRRVANVSAALRPGFKSSAEVIEDLEKKVFVEFKEKWPELSIDLVGEQREQSDTATALKLNYLMALFAIYALLAIPFKSYLQPIIIMSAIPFGVVGAVWGHALLQYELSLMSVFGIIALSGVVVNDSLVLVDAANQLRQAGASAHDAIVAGGIRRLRPILLTSLTTFFGLAPMMFETSVQARFLIPMALSLGFGVLFATVVILILVPCLYMMIEDLRGLFGYSVDPIAVPAK